MDKIKINFTTQGGVHLASHRMRMTKPAELLNLGTNGKVEVTIKEKSDPTAQVNVFAKHFDPKNSFLAACSGPDFGYYSVIDICDNHFHREYEQYYRDMCERCDAITCNSKNMQEEIFKETGKLARIINDPITFQKGEVKHTETPKLIWYGHSSNLPPLMKWLEKLPTQVTVVSDVTINHPKVVSVKWKPMVVEKLLDVHDIVLIPTTKFPWTKCKSPNRAVDALYAGKYVITDNKDIYGDLGDFIDIIKDPEELLLAIDAYRMFPDNAKERIKKGQDFVEKTYQDSTIIDGWLAVLKDLGLVKDVEAAA